MKYTKNSIAELDFSGCNLCYTSDSDLRQGALNLNSFDDKQAILNIYVNYFMNILMSMFKFENMPKNIDEFYIKNVLINRGEIAVFNTLSDGIVFQAFSPTGKYNLYGVPTEITMCAFGNVDVTLQSKNTIYKSDDFQIIRVNPMGTPLSNLVYYFCNKIVETQRAIDVNVYANQTPLIFEGTSEQESTMTRLFEQWGKQVRAIFLKKDKGTRAEDCIKSATNQPEFKADKMTEILQFYKAEFFTMLGINHTPFEKHERLLTDEIKSNNQILMLTLNSMLNSINYYLELSNKKFGTNIKCFYSLDNLEIDSSKNMNFDIEEIKNAGGDK